MHTVKFGDKFYPGSMPISELAKQLEIEEGFVVRYKKKEIKEPTAQEMIDG